MNPCSCYVMLFVIYFSESITKGESIETFSLPKGPILHSRMERFLLKWDPQSNSAKGSKIKTFDSEPYFFYLAKYNRVFSKIDIC